MRILVTGITGFIGSNLAKYLMSRGHYVLGIARSIKKLSPYSLLGVDADVVFMDLAKAGIEELKYIIEKHDIDSVIHLAAVSIVRQVRHNPVYAVKVNVLATMKLLEACRRASVERIIIASTDKVYGEGTNRTESSPLEPIELYGATKAAMDILARVWAKTYYYPIIVTRCCNVYGPGDVNPRIIPRTIYRCMKGLKPIIYSNYLGLREYIYIDDVCRAYQMLLESNIAGVFNIGSGEVLSQAEVVKKILEHFPNIEPEYQAHYGQEIKAQSLNSSRIRELLGWKPLISFDEGIKRTIEWWKANWDKLKHLNL